MTAKTFGTSDFRAELTKLMPGYEWTVHKPRYTGLLEATGTQSSGSNRLSTLSVRRRDGESGATYEVKSSGYGVRSPWLHSRTDKTLARALRSLQDHYEAMAREYHGHANALERGRINGKG